MNGVQRFLHGGVNHVRLPSALTAPVRPITDAVIQKPVPRQGSLVAAVAGTFTGTEEALYEFEVVNTTADTPLVTAPLFNGVGNGTMTGIAATGLTARTIEVSLADLGQILTAASADLQGVRVMMKTPGAAGNAFTLRVVRTGLAFVLQGFSLLSQLSRGTSEQEGPEFEWQTVVANADGTVPSTAKRIVFGDDRNNIYVQYKKVVGGVQTYVFEPPIAQDYPEKTQISFVTGEYSVELIEDVASVPTLRETYSNIITLYDLLNEIKSNSTYLLVQGAVANDRTAGGQNLLELSINTDARFISNIGFGSAYATGFKDVSIAANSPTELIEATCLAATQEESLGAALGAELWEIRGSVSGLLTTSIRSGQLFSNAFFAARIPQKFPPGYIAVPQGSMGVKEINYNDANRSLDEENNLVPPQPPICVDSQTLGVNARDAVVTLNYRRRPPVDNCSCKEDKGIALSPFCLGVVTEGEGGTQMPYSAGAVTRLTALYQWFSDTVRENSNYFSAAGGGTGYAYGRQDPFISQPVSSGIIGSDNPHNPTAANFAFVSLFEMIKQFEQALAEVDKLEAGALKTAAEDAWDDAVTEFETDIDDEVNPAAGTPPTDPLVAVVSFEDLTEGDAVSIFTDPADDVQKVRLATTGDDYYGFVRDTVVAPATVNVYFSGLNDEITSTEETTQPPASVESWTWQPSVAIPGNWVKIKGNYLYGTDPEVLTVMTLIYVNATSGKLFQQVTTPKAGVIGFNILADRYRSRLQLVLITGGISPLGKGDAGTTSGDGCWRDVGDDFYWEVLVGDVPYAWAFTGVPYYSAKKYPGGVVVNGTTTPSDGFYSTKEFGFILDVPCKQNLVVGDQVVIVIGNAGQPQTYIKGDKLQLGIIGAADIPFFGGNDGDNIQTWHVSDSVDGARDPYLLDTDAPVAYDDTEIEFLITQGQIPFKKDDKFKFSIEGGNFRWRKTVAGVVGAWSADLDIVITPIVLDSGLSLTWTLGASPAVFTGDLYKFLALQPYAVTNIKKPDFEMWQWAVDPAVLVIDFGAAKADIDAIAIAYHTIESDATILVEGGTVAGVYTWDETITWRKDAMGKLLAAPETARYIRLTITGSPTGGIGWFYIGPAIKFTYSAQMRLTRGYEVKRGDGVNPTALFKGMALGGEVQWPEGHLKEADFTPLTAMLDFIKQNNDEAIIIFPQETRQSDLLVATVESDEITFNDVFNFQPDSGSQRRISCTIPLKGVVY